MPTLSEVEIKRDQVIAELTAAAQDATNLTADKFCDCLRSAASVWPDHRDKFEEYCSDQFAVSPSTIGRWTKGQTCPLPSIRVFVLMDLVRHLTHVNHDIC